MKSIVITGGGTGGHILPLIALLPQLKTAFDKIIYIGSEELEETIAKQHELPFYKIKTPKLQRKLTFKNFAIPFKLLGSISKAKKLLKELKPNAILSKGGFVALPIVLAGSSLNIPCFTHESDLSLGLANKLMANKCKAVFTSFKETANGLKNGIYSGSPIRQSLFYKDKQTALKRFNLSGNKPIICITGGSLGSTAINIAVKNSLNQLGKNYDIIHLCGKGKQEEFKSQFYRQYQFITDIEKAFLISDLVVTRGGSNALFELLCLNKPTLVIPLPKKSSRGDQIANANYFAEKNLVKVLPQENLTPSSLVYNINDLFKHKEQYKTAMQNYDVKIANVIICQTILKHI